MYDRVRAFTAISDALGAHIAKHAGILGRLMLVFHALEDDGHPTERIVSGVTAQGAVQLLKRLASHALVIYTALSAGHHGILPVARAAALSILADEPTDVTRGWLTAQCRAFRNAPDWA